jgi:hypothetical protein
MVSSAVDAYIAIDSMMVPGYETGRIVDFIRSRDKAILVEAGERMCTECLSTNHAQDGSLAPCNHRENGRRCRWISAIIREISG